MDEILYVQLMAVKNWTAEKKVELKRKEAIKEAIAAGVDRRLYGVSFMRDGKRIDPTTVYIKEKE